MVCGATFLLRVADSVTFPSTGFAVGTSGPGDRCSSEIVAADLILRVRFGLFAGRRSGSGSYKTKFDSVSNHKAAVNLRLLLPLPLLQEGRIE